MSGHRLSPGETGSLSSFESIFPIRMETVPVPTEFLAFLRQQCALSLLFLLRDTFGCLFGYL